MDSPRLDAYVAALSHELRMRGVRDPRVLQETRDHLADAVEAARGRGLSAAAAEDEAIGRFGSPSVVASAAAEHRYRDWYAGLLAVAIALGLAIAWVDSRPTWDDAGITAAALVLVAALLGVAAPQRPWRWALGVGVWIPLHAVLANRTPGSLAMLVVLLFPLLGAYAGMWTRRLVAGQLAG